MLNTLKRYLKRYLDDPKMIIDDILRKQLSAARRAVAPQLSQDIPGWPVEEIVFRDSVEPERRPTTKEAISRRLVMNRIGLHAADRMSAKLRARDFVLSLAVCAAVAFTMYIVMGELLDSGEMSRQLSAETGVKSDVELFAARVTQAVLAFWFVIVGLVIVGLSSGLHPASYHLFMPKGRLVEDCDVEDAHAFAARVIFRAQPAESPPDLRDTYRPLTVDSTGHAVDGQVIPQDTILSWARIALEDGSYVRASLGATLILCGFSMATGSGWGLIAAFGPAVMLVALAAVRLFFLPDVTLDRSLAGIESLRRSAAAKLVDRLSPTAFAQVEAALASQTATAAADKTAFIQLGRSTGVFAARRDQFAPSAAGMPYGLSVNDLSTHLLCLGSTGTGKTSGVLRPLIAAWTDAKAGGLLVLDGKGVLPAELTGLPDYKVIEPGKDVFAPIENLTPDQVADALYESFSSGGDDESYWEKAACELVRAAAKVLHLCVGISPKQWKWTLGDLYRMIFEAESIAAAKAIIESEPSTKSLHLLPGHTARAYVYFTKTFPALPAETANSIKSNASVWLSLLVNNSQLSEWADADKGVQIEDTLYGARIGLLLPEFRYGQAGAVFAAFAKKRFYQAVKLRGESWKEKDSDQTRVLLIMDEVQSLLAGGTDDASVLPIARSLGLCVVGASQNLDGLQIALQDKPALLEQILGQFRSLVALTVNTNATADFVATRMGYGPRVIYSEMPTSSADAGEAVAAATSSAGGYGTNTLAAQAQWNSSVADARPGFRIVSDAFEMVDQAAEKTGAKQALRKLGFFSQSADQKGTVKIGLHPIVEPEEVELLTSEPFTALAIVNRGNVPRRDLIRLTPMFDFAQATKKGAV
jgi:hypothetical protein